MKNLALSSALVLQSLKTCLAAPASDSSKSAKPVSIDLTWQPNDDVQGVFTFDFAIGTPPQKLRTIYDTGSSDIFVQAAANAQVLDLCKQQTPVNTCFGLFANKTSTTFKDLGPNTYIRGGGVDTGDYFEDTLHIGSLAPRDQTMAEGLASATPFNVFGTGFGPDQVAVTAGSFHEYPPFIPRMVQNGLIESATQSIWLNPDQGRGPNAFPNGNVLLGGLDESLYEGRFVTVPIVDHNSTKIPARGFSWNVALTDLRLGHNGDRSFVAAPGGDSCLLYTGQAYTVYPDETFKNLIAAYPQAKLNATTKFYDVPCDQRANKTNTWAVTISDPRNAKNKITVEMPSEATVWPTNRLVAGGDPNTCSIAANAWTTVFGASNKYNCMLGVSFLKNIYMVLDMEHEVVSIAKAAKRSRKPEIVAIPRQGVKGLGY